MSIFDDATLYAPLETSLELTTGTGNPSFTRATTATVFDNEGKLITVPSGIARFEGGRFRENLLAHSEDISQAVWVAAPGGNVTKSTSGGDNTLVYTVASANLYQIITNRAIPGATYTFNIELKSISGLTTDYILSIRDQPFTFIHDENISPITTDWAWYSITATLPSVVNSNLYVHLRQDRGGSTATEIAVRRCSLTNVSGQLDTSFDDYVSTNILTNPWHGAGADGSKWFNTNKDGTSISEDSLTGYLSEDAATNLCLWNRDLTNAAWTKTNITATLDQTGIDNVTNKASSLEATSANGTCFQSITLAAATRTLSAYIKRITGTGTIEITRDGGSTYTDITSDINSSAWTRVYIRGTSVLNPQIGFRIVASGDKIAVDYCQDEAGAEETSPILTTTTSVTRNADSLTYQTASNFNDTNGAIAIQPTDNNWTTTTGKIGSSSTGLHLSSSNSGVQALDGTNTVNGPTGTPTGLQNLAIGWAGSDLKAASCGFLGTAGSYDGSMNLSNIAILGNIRARDLYVWTDELTDGELQSASSRQTGNIFLNDVARTFFLANGYPIQYNDGMLAFLRDFYSESNKSLPDLLARYIKEQGKFFP